MSTPTSCCPCAHRFLHPRCRTSDLAPVRSDRDLSFVVRSKVPVHTFSRRTGMKPEGQQGRIHDVDFLIPEMASLYVGVRTRAPSETGWVCTRAFAAAVEAQRVRLGRRAMPGLQPARLRAVERGLRGHGRRARQADAPTLNACAFSPLGCVGTHGVYAFRPPTTRSRNRATTSIHSCRADPLLLVRLVTNSALPECPYDGIAVALLPVHRHILISVIHDTLGGRVSLTLLSARERLLRCHRMTNSPPPVQASGGLRVLWAGARAHLMEAGTPRSATKVRSNETRRGLRPVVS